MADKIVHRGPDNVGYWCDKAIVISLGHRRLAIVDLTPAGAQPMQSACGRYVISFNGEIYNHLSLRAELNNTAFTTTTKVKAFLIDFPLFLTSWVVLGEYFF
jgi:asparagine synthase (glutamine-hydrolysing)